MLPGASVSALCFASKHSQYFAVGKIAADQLADYGKRKGWNTEQAEKACVHTCTLSVAWCLMISSCAGCLRLSTLPSRRNLAARRVELAEVDVLGLFSSFGNCYSNVAPFSCLNPVRV